MGGLPIADTYTGWNGYTNRIIIEEFRVGSTATEGNVCALDVLRLFILITQLIVLLSFLNYFLYFS